MRIRRRSFFVLCPVNGRFFPNNHPSLSGFFQRCGIFALMSLMSSSYKHAICLGEISVFQNEPSSFRTKEFQSIARTKQTILHHKH